MSEESSETITITLPLHQALDAAERRICEVALARTGSLVKAAAALGIDRNALKRRLVKYGIPHRSLRGGPRRGPADAASEAA